MLQVRGPDASTLCPCTVQENSYPNAGDGLWGNDGEAPSFLYAMPLGGKRVFLEETCLVAKPALPFAGQQRCLHTGLLTLMLLC
jgi:hypothetical protein